MTLGTVGAAGTEQSFRRAFRNPRLNVTDRLTDVLVAVALVLVLIDSQQIWDVAYSRPRSLTVFYLLVAASLLGKFWRRVPPALAWAVGLYSTFVLLGHVMWSHAVGWVGADTVWQELRMSVGLLLFAVAFGARGWVRWRWLLVITGSLTAVTQLLLILSGRTFSSTAGEAAFYGFRPFGATFALLMLASFVILCSQRHRTGPTLVLTVFLGCSVVLAQHRSVWVSLLVVCSILIVLSFRDDNYYGARVPAVLTLAFGLVVVVLPVITPWSILPGTGIGGGADAGNSVPASVTDSDSFGWRLDMWSSRLTAARGVHEWVAGAVFGPNPVIGPEATVVNAEFSAHNLAIDQLTMVGLAGLCLLLFLLWIGLRGPSLWPELQVFLGGLLAFGLFYNLTAWSYLLLGCAVALARGSRSGPHGTSHYVREPAERSAVPDQEQHQGL